MNEGRELISSARWRSRSSLREEGTQVLRFLLTRLQVPTETHVDHNNERRLLLSVVGRECKGRSTGRAVNGRFADRNSRVCRLTSCRFELLDAHPERCAFPTSVQEAWSLSTPIHNQTSGIPDSDGMSQEAGGVRVSEDA